MKVNSNSNNFREMFWDESNRLRVVYDQNSYQLQHYIYDAAGERTLKASSQIESVYENGQIDASSTTIGLYTTYVSPYMVVDANQRYSKHYFNGTQRVASKMGEQDIIVFENMPLPIAPETEIENTPFTDFDTLKNKQISDLSYYLSKSTDKTTARNFNIKFKEFKKQDTQTQQITENNSAYAAPQYAELYYYHSDHLGTGTFLSDFEGNPYQFFLNLPFGETMAEQHSYSGEYTNRYKFNGKELDEETGFYYYGARYYNPKFSIWLSVDPLAEQFPNWNPYNYTMQNPINLTDPTGMSPEDGEGDPPVTAKKDNKNYTLTGVEGKNAIYTEVSEIEEVLIKGTANKNPRLAGSRPKGMSESDSLNEIVQIDGEKYHKNTSNIFAQIGNTVNSWLGGDNDYFVEHKSYDPVDDRFIHGAVDGGVGFLTGHYIGKAIGGLFGSTTSNVVEQSTINVVKESARKYSIYSNGSATEFFKTLNPGWNGAFQYTKGVYSTTSFTTSSGVRVMFNTASKSTGQASVKISGKGIQYLFRFTNN